MTIFTRSRRICSSFGQSFWRCQAYLFLSTLALQVVPTSSFALPKTKSSANAPETAEGVKTGRAYRVLHYRISLQVDPQAAPADFEAEARIRFKPTAPLKSLQLDAQNLKVQQIQMVPNGMTLPFSLQQGQGESQVLDILFPAPLNAGSTHELSLFYKGQIRQGHDGFFRVSDPDNASRGALLFTHFEALSARKFFPCDDEPTDKATSEVEATVPPDFTVISNGKLVSERRYTVKKKTWKTVRWELKKPISTYLISLAVGRFGKVKASARKGEPEVALYVDPQKTSQASFVAEATREAMRFYQDLLGVKYPWPKYAIIGIPTFLWGGMENASATHMNQERTLLPDDKSELRKSAFANLTAHELAHQWFGDLVTMKTWEDVWLNESFASYYATLATHSLFGGPESELALLTDTANAYYRQENGPRSHPIVMTNLKSPDEAFDSINYTKGENVLRMLSAYMGEPAYRQGIRDYLEKYSYRNASNQDLFSSLEKSSGQSLQAFRSGWLLQKGFPLISASAAYDPEKKTLQIDLSQRPNQAFDGARPYVFQSRMVAHRTRAPEYHKEMLLRSNQVHDRFSLNLIAEPEWVTLDSDAVVLAQWEYNDVLQAQLPVRALKDPSPLARYSAARQILDPWIKGKSLSSGDLQVVATVLSSDPSLFVRMALLRSLRYADQRYVPDVIGKTLFELAQQSLSTSPPWQKESVHAVSSWRSELLATLGRVDNEAGLKLLGQVLNQPKSSLDDTSMAALGAAGFGTDEALALLKTSLQKQGRRGYSYRYAILSALGAFQNPRAAKEIEAVSQDVSSDFMGRLGSYVINNAVLRNSVEWVHFVTTFIIRNQRFNDEVKSRILQTIEDSKSKDVQSALEAIVQKADSARLKEAANRILQKNFSGSRGT